MAKAPTFDLVDQEVPTTSFSWARVSSWAAVGIISGCIEVPAAAVCLPMQKFAVTACGLVNGAAAPKVSLPLAPHMSLAAFRAETSAAPAARALSASAGRMPPATRESLW